MIKGTLTKLSDNKNNIRTATITGEASEPPTVGQSFVMLAEPLVEGFACRLVTTSTVLEITGDEFKTLNSIYKWEALSV